jgi:hypothetical protein
LLERGRIVVNEESETISVLGGEDALFIAEKESDVCTACGVVDDNVW